MARLSPDWGGGTPRTYSTFRTARPENTLQRPIYVNIDAWLYLLRKKKVPQIEITAPREGFVDISGQDGISAIIPRWPLACLPVNFHYPAQPRVSSVTSYLGRYLMYERKGLPGGPNAPQRHYLEILHQSATVMLASFPS